MDAPLIVTTPTELDHRIAALQGIYLCERCGHELKFPANPQLCGRCETDEAE
jgi:rubrerythrin